MSTEEMAGQSLRLAIGQNITTIEGVLDRLDLRSLAAHRILGEANQKLIELWEEIADEPLLRKRDEDD